MTHIAPARRTHPAMLNQVSRAAAPDGNYIRNLAGAMADMVEKTGFATRALLIRQGFDPDRIDRWGLMAWCKAIADGTPTGRTIDPRMTDCCNTGVLTGTPPFRLRQWLRHRETGLTGTVIRQAPIDGGRQQGAPLPKTWMVTIKTAAGPKSGPASEFEAD